MPINTNYYHAEIREYAKAVDELIDQHEDIQIALQEIIENLLNELEIAHETIEDLESQLEE